MKKYFLFSCFIFQILVSVSVAQPVSNLPINVSYASAEVWGDSIYFIGGSSSYSGAELFRRIYKYDGNSWSYFDTIPFNHVWGIETTSKGDSIFIFGGWPSGAGKLYLYRISNKTWTQLTDAPSVFSMYGSTIEYYNGNIYAFYNGYAARFNLQTNAWVNLATNNNQASFLSSTVYNGEIYLSGWYNNNLFYKYNPSNNQWIQLQNLPEFISAGSLRVINNKIYLVGGSAGYSSGTYSSIYAYNPTTNQWTLDSRTISSKRAYMEDVLYRNKFYLLGGVDVNGQTVNIVEYVMDQTTDVESDIQIPAGFSLEQNYPNPFNPSTRISWQSPVGSHQTLKVYDVLGNEVKTLVDEYRNAGRYEIEFNASGLASGIYFYKLSTGSFNQVKKMILIR